MIKGITVNLVQLTEVGRDDFNAPIYSETVVPVDDVLVAPSTTDDITSGSELFGKKAVYTIAIPKGDSHVWEDQIVEFFGSRWHVFGYPQEGIEANIPLRWNAKWMVERYGG